MFKNLSFKAILGIFAGVLLVLVVGTIVAIKMVKGQGNKPVVTKRFDKPAVQAQAAPAEPAEPRPIQAPTPVVQTNPTTDLAQAVTGLNISVSNLDRRVEALEENVAKSHQHASSASGGARRKPQTKPAASTPEPTPMAGYKTLAVVSGRAYVRAPDGSEFSVAKGETIPVIKAKSVVTDTGMVITTSDQRIEPR